MLSIWTSLRSCCLVKSNKGSMVNFRSKLSNLDSKQSESAKTISSDIQKFARSGFLCLMILVIVLKNTDKTCKEISVMGFCPSKN